MFDNSIIKKTGQGWKVRLVLLFEFVGMSALSLSVIFPEPASKVWLITVLAGIHLSIGSFVFASIAIRCPICRAQWIWMAARGREATPVIELLEFSKCPRCGHEGGSAGEITPDVDRISRNIATLFQSAVPYAFGSLLDIWLVAWVWYSLITSDNLLSRFLLGLLIWACLLGLGLFYLKFKVSEAFGLSDDIRYAAFLFNFLNAQLMMGFFLNRLLVSSLGVWSYLIISLWILLSVVYAVRVFNEKVLTQWRLKYWSR